MPKIKTDGLDDVIKALDADIERKHARMSAALNAAADLAVDAFRQAVPENADAGHGHSGHLKDHIVKRGANVGGMAASIDIEPDGIRDDGQRYATVGYVLEYGRSDMKATHWMSGTNRRMEKKYVEKMREVLTK